MFPGPGAQIIRNEAGELLGWDYPSEEPDFDEDEADRRFHALRCDGCGNHPEDCDCDEDDDAGDVSEKFGVQRDYPGMNGIPLRKEVHERS